MRMKNIISALVIGLLGLAAQQVLASTYYLNQSNTLADGVNYAQVDILENAGNLDFTVTALSPTNWKFSNFYFNLGGDVGAVSLMGLPSGWSVPSSPAPYNISTFGLFSDGESGAGNSLQSSFTFTADSSVALTLANLVANNDGWIFAAHVQCQNKQDSPCSAESSVDGVATSHFIAGPGELAPVPLPAAAWLFGSALFGFITLSNRRRV